MTRKPGSYQPETGFWVFIISLLVVAIVVLIVVYFTLFQPKDPKIQIKAINLGTINSGAGASIAETLLDLTFGLYVSVYNPNRARFLYSGLQAYMYFNGIEIGFAPIAGHEIRERSTEVFTFYVTAQEASNFLYNPNLQSRVGSAILPITVQVGILGNVTVLNLFSHHTNTGTKCVVSISAASQNIVAYICKQ
eukprot:c19640_g1_i1 orf=539-1117(+)